MAAEFSRSSQVCRNLFGTTDSKLNSEFLLQQLEILHEHSCSVWNFDFLRGVPKTGRYLWEQVSAGNSSSSKASVPAQVTTKNVPSAQTTPVQKENSIRRLLSKEKKSVKENVVRNRISKKKLARVKKPQKKVLVQTIMKDFMKVRKPRGSKLRRSSRHKTLPPRMTTRCPTMSYSASNKTRGR